MLIRAQGDVVSIYEEDLLLDHILEQDVFAPAPWNVRPLP